MANNRKVLLINRKFQLRFSLFVCSWLFPFFILVPFIFMSFFDSILIQLGGGADLQISMGNIEELKQGIFWRLILVQANFMIVTFLISLFVSHKVAGPIHKLHLAFEEFAGGGKRTRLVLEKTTIFKNLPKSIIA